MIKVRSSLPHGLSRWPLWPFRVLQSNILRSACWTVVFDAIARRCQPRQLSSWCADISPSLSSTDVSHWPPRIKEKRSIFHLAACLIFDEMTGLYLYIKRCVINRTCGYNETPPLRHLKYIRVSMAVYGDLYIALPCSYYIQLTSKEVRAWKTYRICWYNHVSNKPSFRFLFMCMRQTSVDTKLPVFYFIVSRSVFM